MWTQPVCSFPLDQAKEDVMKHPAIRVLCGMNAGRGAVAVAASLHDLSDPSLEGSSCW